MCRVRLVGGDGVFWHLHGGHMHLEGHVPDEDCQSSRRPCFQYARSGKGDFFLLTNQNHRNVTKVPNYTIGVGYYNIKILLFYNLYFKYRVINDGDD